MTCLEISTYFREFDDCWRPFLGRQGPEPTYVISLDNSEGDTLRDALLRRLPIQADGSIPWVAGAWAARGVVEE